MNQLINKNESSVFGGKLCPPNHTFTLGAKL